MIDLVAALRAVVAELERLSVRYIVVGSVAAASWGVARATRDVDVVAELSSADLERMIDGLRPDEFYVPVEAARDATRTGGSFNVLHTSSGGKVDVFVSRSDDAFTQSRFDRRVRAEVLGVTTWIATAEDVVLAKLRWRLESRSEVQWRDCVEIASANRLDRAYLRGWADALGVEVDLADLLAVFEER